MSHPTSLRLADDVKQRLDQQASKGRETPSGLAARLIDEGLRMAEHPGVMFHNSPAHGRVAALRGGPEVAEVMDVMTGLEARGEERVAETATWFALDPSQVRVALGYYTTFRAEIDEQMQTRHRQGQELRRRSEAEQAFLG